MEEPERSIKFVSAFLESLKEQKTRAAVRLADRGAGFWNFAILGAEFESDEIDLGAAGSIRKVDDCPGLVVLAGVLKDKRLLSLVDRYASGVRFELSVPSDPVADNQFPFTLAWWLMSVIRIHAGTDFLVPLASDISWSAMAAAEQNSVRVCIVEDVPGAKKFGEKSKVPTSSVSWAVANLEPFIKLLSAPAFRLSVDLFTTHQHQANLRMVTASLWSAIEPLFDVSQELTFRVAAYAATLLEPPGKARFDRYQRIKKLYGVRSKAVHGSSISNEQLSEHVVEVRSLLRLMLIKIIEMGTVPTAAEFDLALMTGEWKNQSVAS